MASLSTGTDSSKEEEPHSQKQDVNNHQNPNIQHGIERRFTVSIKTDDEFSSSSRTGNVRETNPQFHHRGEEEEEKRTEAAETEALA